MFIGNRIKLRQRQFCPNARIILMQKLKVLFDKKRSRFIIFETQLGSFSWNNSRIITAKHTEFGLMENRSDHPYKKTSGSF